uniref:NADH-ubiquinone oxidoreductase chain 6 n=1 Tax=Enneapterygius etheostoma TaxID=3354692 RepID=A0A1V1G106_9TELE|nr:NADH dehydrogenase subunit 6 [Enneapterygius etheostomus]
MAYVMVMFLFGLVLGMGAVASNPSPYFAALGLVVVAGMGCGVLAGHGGPFLSLVLFLIYLGGMLVVFAYSAALAAEPYPESWGELACMWVMGAYLGGSLLGACLLWGGWQEGAWAPVGGGQEFFVMRGDMAGVAVMYSMGGGMLVLAGGVLLLALLVILELTRGVSRGALRAV